jgi:hypothetical protein
LHPLHFYRFESKKNGTFARLNESYAKWIVKLIDQRLVTFEGKLLFPPAKSTIGAQHVSPGEKILPVGDAEVLPSLLQVKSLSNDF